MSSALKIVLQYILPHHLISAIVGLLSRCQIRWFKQLLIKSFCKHYQVDLSEAQLNQPEQYASFHAFFTRALQSNARQFDYNPNHLLSPVDGTLSQCGLVHNNTLMQAKQHNYTLFDLLADKQQAHLFEQGYGLTFYLAPRDYHRVHMPLKGQLLQTQYIPGRLFSVNPQTADSIPNLFTRNERLVCLFDTQKGPMVIVLVGAMIVGHIHTSWAGLINPACQTRRLVTTDYRDQAIELNQGEELGYFAMGSTVITLLGPSHASSLPDINNKSSQQAKVGERLGYYYG